MPSIHPAALEQRTQTAGAGSGSAPPPARPPPAPGEGWGAAGARNSGVLGDRRSRGKTEWEGGGGAWVSRGEEVLCKGWVRARGGQRRMGVCQAASLPG